MVKMKEITTHLMLAIVAASFGSGWQVGYTTTVINSPEQIIKTWMMHTPNGVTKSAIYIDNIYGAMNGMYSVGGIIGSLVSGFMAQYIGRKRTLIYNNLLVFIAGILEFFLLKINYYEVLMFCRFLLGINNGINAGVCPMYCVELSPKNLRGAMGFTYSFAIAISLLVAVVLGNNKALGTTKLWPTLLGITIFPAIFQVITLFFCCESPKYLLAIKKNEEKAQKALIWLRKNDSLVKSELEDMKDEVAQTADSEKINFKDYFKKKYLRTPLFIGLVLMVGQQFSGINAIMFYSTNILTIYIEGDTTSITAQDGTIIIVCFDLATTFVALVLVEFAGRRTLLLVAFSGMAVVTTIIAILLIVTPFKGLIATVVTFICIYVVCFAVGAGAIPWFIVSELFQEEARGFPVAISCLVNWICSAIVGFSFPPLKAAVGNHIFWFYFIALVLTTIFIYFVVPETKGKTTQQIIDNFK